MILLFLIRLLHLVLYISLILSIFQNNYLLKELALIILLFLLVQFITNYGKCTLTQIEYLIMGKKYKDGFLYRLINPIIRRDENYFNYYYYLIHLSLIVILIYQLYNYSEIKNSCLLNYITKIYNYIKQKSKKI